MSKRRNPFQWSAFDAKAGAHGKTNKQKRREENMIVYEERTHSAPSYRIKLSQATLTDLKALAYAVEAAESGITDELFGDNGVSFTSRPVGSTVFGVFRNAPGQDEMEVVRVPLDRGE